MRREETIIVGLSPTTFMKLLERIFALLCVLMMLFATMPLQMQTAYAQTTDTEATEETDDDTDMDEDEDKDDTCSELRGRARSGCVRRSNRGQRIKTECEGLRGRERSDCVRAVPHRKDARMDMIKSNRGQAKPVTRFRSRHRNRITDTDTRGTQRRPARANNARSQKARARVERRSSVRDRMAEIRNRVRQVEESQLTTRPERYRTRHNRHNAQ
jgi:hypothetical protein